MLNINDKSEPRKIGDEVKEEMTDQAARILVDGTKLGLDPLLLAGPNLDGPGLRSMVEEPLEETKEQDK